MHVDTIHCALYKKHCWDIVVCYVLYRGAGAVTFYARLCPTSWLFDAAALHHGCAAQLVE